MTMHSEPTPSPLLLCAGSMVRFGFVDTIDAAVAAGFDGISVWKRTIRRAQSREAIDLSTMRSLLEERGLLVPLIEGTAGWVPGWSPATPDDLSFDEALDYAEALGARSVLAFAEAGVDHDVLVESFVRACDRARQRDLEVVLEFLPWGSVPALADALRVVHDAGRANGRIVFDTWHHARSGGASLPDSLDPSLIACIQLADGPAQPDGDDVVHETMFRRRAPGEGEFAIGDTLRELQGLGVACPIGVEVYDEALVELSAHQLADRLATTSRRVIPSWD